MVIDGKYRQEMSEISIQIILQNQNPPDQQYDAYQKSMHGFIFERVNRSHMRNKRMLGVHSSYFLKKQNCS